ncbi:energy transducer TonB [Sphingomonas sp. NIBR02145]|uniref:energy transducer TonB n=1 Tax=Sphingomonas sp. NIBR02145 TaxID=3014784 RepID=UPI0022B47F91|nr:energy transducer TonB [Sphingomonas sp. NIBR02145]WHU01622.1 TonB family protein [Sphingomonas sp. NIBR02145]
MYAETRYRPQQSRTVSIGASLLFSGAIIIGMIYSSPNFVRIIRDTTLTTYPVEERLPPPVEKPKEQPKPDPKPAMQPPVTAPDPVIKTMPTDNRIETTPDIPSVTPDNSKPVETGPVFKPEPRVEPAVLPLVGARRDPRYAEDFQPAYPASELRAQRDGRVSVRVLVGADGRVKSVEQVSATSAAFFDATRRQALSKWRFKPATRGGVAEESWMTLSVTFEIKDQ